MTTERTSGMQLVVFPTKDLDGTKKIFSTLLGTDPYVDGPYYVGFRAGGPEVGLDPNGTGGPICYWDVTTSRPACSRWSRRAPRSTRHRTMSVAACWSPRSRTRTATSSGSGSRRDERTAAFDGAAHGGQARRGGGGRLAGLGVGLRRLVVSRPDVAGVGRRGIVRAFEVGSQTADSLTTSG